MSNPLGRPPKYPFFSLALGASFTIRSEVAPAGGLTSLQALARYHSRALGTRVTVFPWIMEDGDEGFRVTRIGPDARGTR